MCFTVTCWFPPVRLRCSVSKRLHRRLGRAVHHRCPFNQNAISSPKSSARASPCPFSLCTPFSQSYRTTSFVISLALVSPSHCPDRFCGSLGLKFSLFEGARQS